MDNDDFIPDDYEVLRQDHLHQEVARRVEKETVERLYDAATHVSVQNADVDAIATGLHELESEGFRHTDDDGDVLITGYASPGFYYELCDSWDSWHESADEIDTVQVHSIKIRVAPSLPDGSAVLIHDNALAPSLLPASTRPFVIKHPQGVIILSTPDPDA